MLETVRLLNFAFFTCLLSLGLQGQTEFEKTKSLAEEGDSDSQYKLGTIYEKGDGWPKDLKNAVKWYRKSAEQGHSISQYKLGRMYLYGDGVPKDDKAAVKWYRKSAEQGYVRAQTWLGSLYHRNNLFMLRVNVDGVEKDNELAIKWYDKAARQESSVAMFHLPGLYWETGNNLLGTYWNAKGLEVTYKRLAEEGNATGQFNLAESYMSGSAHYDPLIRYHRLPQLLPKNESEAAKLYRKAAIQGHAPSQYNLGWLLEVGLGVTHDHEKAVYWFGMAAKQGVPSKKQEGNSTSPIGSKEAFNYLMGNAYLRDADNFRLTNNYKMAVFKYGRAAEKGRRDAQFNLGIMYHNGDVVPKDQKIAAYWFGLAAKQGVPEAQYNLGGLYENGWGVAKDMTMATYWISQAAIQGLLEAEFKLGLCYAWGSGVPKSAEEAIRWLKKSAVKGSSGAQFFLGDIFFHGKGVLQDYREAVKWYTKSAKQGDADARFKLGLMYEEGKGVPKDVKEAVKWFRLAAEQGNMHAQGILGLMYAKGDGVIEDFVSAYAWTIIAKANGIDTERNLGILKNKMTSEQIAVAQALAKKINQKIEDIGEENPINQSFD